jgi:hypothetical protein
MLEIKNISICGLERSLIASGNPMTVGEIQTAGYTDNYLAPPTITRGKKLGSSKPSSGHDNFLSGIIVQFDVKYPLYWSPEFQRYHFIQIISSQSTMHRLTTAASLSDFNEMFNKYVDPQIKDIIKKYSDDYNRLQEFKLSDKDHWYHHPHNDETFSESQFEEEVYKAFMRLRSNLPSGYEMWMTVSTNYLQLKTIYNQRKGHKLKEDWGAFIKMCDELPMFKELTIKEN